MEKDMDNPPELEMTEIREFLDRQLNRPLTEGEWRLLVKRDYPSDLWNHWTDAAERRETVSDVLALVRDMRRAYKPGHETQTASPRMDWQAARRGETSEKLLSRYMHVLLRIRAVSGLMALEAGKDAQVSEFRSRVLGGELLMESEIHTWIRHDHYSRRQWPNEPLDELRYYAPGDEIETATVFAGEESLLQLSRLSRRLARRYGWEEAQATTFVLAGTMPWLLDVTATLERGHIYGASARLVLRIDPAVSPKELAEYYARERKALLGGRHRELTEKTMELALFVAEQEEGTWEERMGAWNKGAEHMPLKYHGIDPEKWKYQNVRNFQRDAVRARGRLLRVDAGQPVNENEEYDA